MKNNPSFDFSILIRPVLFLTVLLSLTSFVIYLKNHYTTTRQQTLLNTTRPSFELLLQYAFGTGPTPPIDDLKQYLDYFQLVDAYLDKNDQASMMLGYLQNLNGNDTQAHHYFQHAYILNQTSLINQYNYGLMLFQQGQYQEATHVLQTSTQINPQEQFTQLNTSIIYHQLVPKTLWPQIGARLIQLQQHARALLIESVKRASSSSTTHTPIPLKPRIF